MQVSFISFTKTLSYFVFASRIFIITYFISFYYFKIVPPSTILLHNLLLPLSAFYLAFSITAKILAKREELTWWPWCELLIDCFFAIYAITLFPKGSYNVIAFLPFLFILTFKTTDLPLLVPQAFVFLLTIGTYFTAPSLLKIAPANNPYKITAGFVFGIISFLFLAALAAYLGRKYKQRDKEREALLLLIRANQELGTTLQFSRVTELLFKVVTTMFYCHTCGLYMVEKREEQIVGTLKGIATPFTKNYPDFDLELKESFLTAAFREGKTLIIDDLLQENEPIIPRARPLRSMVIAPILFKDERLGLLFLIHSIPKLYSKDDAELLSLLSNQIAICLKNISLYQTTAKMAITDSLTNLYTHGYFQEQLMALVPKTKINRKPLTVAMLDIDFFKNVNDNHGHPQGDYLLKQLAGLMSTQMRTTDIIARYGGDEFAICLPETDKMTGALIMERLRRAIEDYQFILGKQMVKCTISIGVASVPDSASSAKELIEAADAALYKSKQEGRNRVTYA